MNAGQIRSLQPALAALLGRFRPCFSREATFTHWQSYLAGLMADLKRKSIESDVFVPSSMRLRKMPWTNRRTIRIKSI